jgi:hypothetical protein
MESEILKLVGGGGGVVACVALVIIFTRHIKDMHSFYSVQTTQSLSDMTTKFNTEHAQTRKDFQEQIQSITNQVFTAVSENTKALSCLELAVREMQVFHKITQDDHKPT